MISQNKLGIKDDSLVYELQMMINNGASLEELEQAIEEKYNGGTNNSD